MSFPFLPALAFRNIQVFGFSKYLYHYLKFNIGQLGIVNLQPPAIQGNLFLLCAPLNAENKL